MLVKTLTQCYNLIVEFNMMLQRGNCFLEKTLFERVAE